MFSPPKNSAFSIHNCIKAQKALIVNRVLLNALKFAMIQKEVIDMGVGQELKKILRDKKISIKQLSEESGISINTLYSITKRDSVRVDAVVLQQIASTLGVSISDLMGNDGRIFTEKMLDEELDRAFFYKLDEHLAGLTAREKDPLYRLTLAQAEEWAKYCKQTRKTPPEAQEEAPEGE